MYRRTLISTLQYAYSASTIAACLRLRRAHRPNLGGFFSSAVSYRHQHSSGDGEHLSNAAKTGSDALSIKASEFQAEISGCIEKQFGTSPNPIDTIILAFNSLRRIHMGEQDADRRRHIEAQAWRKIQTISESEIDNASDYGVAIVVASWAYFTRHWENGQRGPLPPPLAERLALTNQKGSGVAPTIDPQVLITSLNELYPVENDVSYTIDHTSAILHEIDVFGAESDTEAEDGDASSHSATENEDIANMEIDAIDEDATDISSAPRRSNPPPQRSANNNSSDRPKSSQSEAHPQRKVLRRKQHVTEALEAPRAEVLDEVFE